MKRFKDIINEAIISSGQNLPGTKLLLGNSQKAKKFIDKIKEINGFEYKFQDVFVVSKPVPDNQCTEIKLGKGVSDYYIQHLLDGIIYHIIGNSSITDSIFSYTKRRGKGGKDFEHQFKNDLLAYMSAPEGHMPNLMHPDVMEKVINIFKSKNIDLQAFGADEFKVSLDGGKNQKRPIQFSGTDLVVTNSNEKTLTDVTLEIPQGTFYFSLKFSDNIYIINSSVKPFIEKADEKTRAKFYNFFGLSGEQMAGFGSDFFARTSFVSSSKVKKNIEKLITSSFGSGYILIHKFSKNNVFVENLDSKTTAKISSDLKYTYPENGKRKYAGILFKTEIHGTKFNGNLQFRDTRSDLKPSYLRFNLLKIK